MLQYSHSQKKGGEIMKDTAERRLLILERLCERRTDSISNLAVELCVSRRTMRYDIEALSCSYPIYTSKGRNGGVYVMDGYHIGMKYLTNDQCRLLERLSTTLTGEDLKLMQEILKTFRKPVLQK